RVFSRRSPCCSSLSPYTTLFRSQRRLETLVAPRAGGLVGMALDVADAGMAQRHQVLGDLAAGAEVVDAHVRQVVAEARRGQGHQDRKSTRLNSSHVKISYAVFCL